MVQSESKRKGIVSIIELGSRHFSFQNPRKNASNKMKKREYEHACAEEQVKESISRPNMPRTQALLTLSLENLFARVGYTFHIRILS